MKPRYFLPPALSLVDRSIILKRNILKELENLKDYFLQLKGHVLLYIQWITFRIGKETDTNGYQKESCEESRKEEEIS
ncbi:MAG: hypothetical protein HQL21_00785 [Candidatus Omnitrophica bacterium]|nr:hypothetical protein [Candidatus Omnitrophota bacterium]